MRRWKALKFRWQYVIKHEACKLIGHKWHDPDGQEKHRYCLRCKWMPSEAPYTPSPVAGFGRGWRSLLPWTPLK